MACVVEGCKSHTTRKVNTNDLVTFHRFPKDEAFKNIWVQRISRWNWTPKIHSRVCSNHFTLNSFVCNVNLKYRRLRANAIPTLNLHEETNVNEIEINDAGPSSSTVFYHQAPHLNHQRPLSDSEENTPASKCSKTMAPVGTNSDFHLEVPEYIKKIGILERELERVKKVSKRRLRKINELTKRNSRICKKNSQLFDILVEKLNQEDIALEHIALLEK